MGENRSVGLEGDDGASVLALADDLHLRRGRALAVSLFVDLAAAVDLGDEQSRKRVHARYAHAVQTARDLIAALVELTARMEHRKHHFESRFALFLVVVGRDSSTVVLDGYRVVFVYGDLYVRAVACQRLVDRVVDHLVNQMVKTLFADVAYIHGRTFADCFQALHLNIRRRIFFFLLLDDFLFRIH